MRTAVRLTLAVFITWCAPLCFSAPAHADTAVAALGVRSVDGEYELERRLGTALRNAASSVGSWSVAKREASLEQMTLALGCEDSDVPCLGEIAKTLGVATLVYGTVVGSAESYDVTVFQYDSSDKRVHSAVTHGLKAQQLRGPGAREAIMALLWQLNTSAQPAPQAPATGQLRVHGDLPGAQIAVDGATVGALDEHGMLTLELPPGKHVVRAAGAAFAPAEEKVATLEAGGSTQVELPIAKPPTTIPPPVVMPNVDTPAARPSFALRRAFGWATLGLGAAFAVATVYSWVRIEQINDDSDFLAYRGAFPRAGSAGGVGNVCPLASRGELAMRDPSKAGIERNADDLCNQADTLQTLQYVFLGGAIVSAGVGTYLLVSAKRAERRSISFAPRLGFQSAALEARLRF